MVIPLLTRIILAVALLSAAVISNASSIDFTVDASILTSPAGGTATFFGTVTNNSGSALNASDFFFNFSGYDATSVTPSQDLAVIIADFPIANGTTTSSVDLFSVAVAALPNGTSFPIQVQLEDTPGDLSTLQTVTVNVTAVPLPDSAMLLAAGL